MKKFIRPLLTLLTAAFLVTATPQQQPQTDLSAVRREASLRERLALTHDQRIQIHTINLERKARLSALQNDASQSPAARKQKSRDIRLETETRIRALLNEDQRAEYDQIKRERREQSLRNRETNTPALSPSAPPPPPQQ